MLCYQAHPYRNFPSPMSPTAGADIFWKARPRRSVSSSVHTPYESAASTSQSQTVPAAVPPGYIEETVPLRDYQSNQPGDNMAVFFQTRANVSGYPVAANWGQLVNQDERPLEGIKPLSKATLRINVSMSARLTWRP